VPDSTHQVAQRAAPGCQVVSVDSDPVVVSLARARLPSTPHGSCEYVDADLRDTETILARAASTLDLARPVAVLLLAVLHFVGDADDPAAIVAALAGGIAPGSFIAVSDLTGDFAPEEVNAAVAAYNSLAVTLVQSPGNRPRLR